MRLLSAILGTVLLAGCAGGRKSLPATKTTGLPPPISIESLLGPVARPARIFNSNFELFRDSGTPWGEGKALGALWVCDLVQGTTSWRIDGLAWSARDGIVAAEETGPLDIDFLRLDQEGKVLSRTRVADLGMDSLVASEFGGRDMLLGQEMFSVKGWDVSGRKVFAPKGKVVAFVLADLDGKDRRALVADDGEGAVAALRADGKTVWRREGGAGVGLPAGLVPIRLGRGKEESIVVLASSAGVSAVSVLDGAGVVSSTFSDETVPELGAALYAADKPAVLAHIGSNLETEHDRLRIRSAADGFRTVTAEADLGRTHAVSVAAADLRGDGEQELVVGTDNGWVLVYDRQARLLAERHFFGSVPYVVGADIDADGDDEILVAERGATSSVWAFGLVQGQTEKSRSNQRPGPP